MHIWLHPLLQRAYYIPVLLAAMWFGWRGGLLAAGLSSVMYLPFVVWTWRTSPAYSASQYVEVGMFFVIGGLAGVLLDLERGHRAKVEDTARKLSEVYAQLQASFEQLRRADRLTALGWSRIETIDDDLGRSAAGGVARAGFDRMVAEVCLGKVGAVAAREVSRFARNSRDWQQLVEMCRVVDTLLVDQEAIYAPRQGNDRLLLGLKGSLNEYELDLLRQRSRPYLFSNSVAPAVGGASLKVLDILQYGDDLRARLQENTTWFRERMTGLGFEVLPGDHPIVPVMIGDAARAARLADLLLAKGVYVIGFSYPVVPVGKARIRTQVSAAHTQEDLELAVSAFAQARDELD